MSHRPPLPILLRMRSSLAPAPAVRRTELALRTRRLAGAVCGTQIKNAQASQVHQDWERNVNLLIPSQSSITAVVFIHSLRPELFLPVSEQIWSVLPVLGRVSGHVLKLRTSRLLGLSVERKISTRRLR